MPPPPNRLDYLHHSAFTVFYAAIATTSSFVQPIFGSAASIMLCTNGINFFFSTTAAVPYFFNP